MAKILIHIGKGVERKTYPLDWDDVTISEALLIEEETGFYWPEFREAVGNGSPKAVRALVGTLRRRGEPGLLMEQVDFKLSDLDIETPVPEEPTAPKEDSAKENPPEPG